MSIMKSCQEASSSTSRFTYDVFLSFRGEDTRKAFTDHLYTALDDARFRTFRDNDGLERGEDIKSKLEKAIRESRMSIIVFSKSYASSTWCLDELVMILKHRTHGHVVLPIFYDVDPSEVRKQNGSFEEAFARHEEKLKSETGEGKEELKDMVGAWRAALRDVADLAGMNLKNEADGHEARFIRKIIKEVRDKVSRATLDIDPHLVGIVSQVEMIQLWLEDESDNVGIVAICGMGGIGKTTIAKLLYNFNFSRFESSSFLENVRDNSQGPDGLLRLQRRVLSDISKTRKVKPNSVAEGTSEIIDALHRKRVFLVLDDVDKCDQLDAILGMRGWLFPGSKIIITTRHQQLPRANEFSKVHRLQNLLDEESLELFSWHAFGKYCPDKGYEEVSKRVACYCGGLPLALKVLGSSFLGQSLDVWKSRLDKLETIPVGEILETLRISYDSLQDEHDKNLFLHLACFFVGSDKNYAVTILDRCEFYTMAGIQNLMDRCLISIDERNNIAMHHLLQQLVRDIVRQESPKEPGERRILWNHKDAFNVLRHDTGTNKVEGLKLDMYLLMEDKHASTNLGFSRKRKDDAFLGDGSNLCSLKRLSLRGNPISSLPNFVRGLTGLEGLNAVGCSRLRKYNGLRKQLIFHSGDTRILEEQIPQSFHCPKTICYLDTCDHVGKDIGMYKLEPIGNVAAELTKSLGLSNLRSMEDENVTLSSWWGMDHQKFPIQEFMKHIYSTLIFLAARFHIGSILMILDRRSLLLCLQILISEHEA